MTGFGIQPGGMSSAGTGTPLGLPVPGSQGYTQNTDIVACRKIDLVARDYATDDTTTAYEHEAMTAQEQLVIIALTERPDRLPFAPTLGDRTNVAGTIPELSTVRGNVEDALRPYTSKGLVQILDVQIQAQGNALFRVVSWRDLTVNQTIGGAATDRRTATAIVT